MKIAYAIFRLLYVTFAFMVRFKVIELDFTMPKANGHGKDDAILFYTMLLGYYFGYTLLIDLLEFIAVRWYRRRISMPSYKQDNYIVGIRHIATMLMVLGAAAAALAFFRINAREVLTTMSIFAAALAIIFKETITNLLNGMVMVFSNHLSIDDIVRIGDHKGKVIDITLMNTQLMNDDDDIIYIPNTAVLSSSIINFTKGNVRRASVDFKLDPRQIGSVVSLEADIVRAMEDFRHLVVPDSYSLRIVEIHEDSIFFKFQFTLEKYDKHVERRLRRHVERFVVDRVARKF